MLDLRNLILAGAVAALPVGASAQSLQNVPGFDGSTITLGVISAQTGPAAVIARPVLAGNEVFYKELNAKGGVAGKYKIGLLIEDNANNEAQTVQRYAKLKDQIVMLGQLFGTPGTKAVAPQANADGMLAAVTSFDNLWLRDASLIPLGATYQIQAMNSIDHYLRTEGKDATKLCSLSSQNAYGTAAFEGFHSALKAAGKEATAEVHFGPTDQDFSGQIAELKNAGCEMVYAALVPPQLVRLAGNAARDNYQPRWILQGPTWHPSLLESPAIDYLEKHAWVSGEGLEWGDPNTPGMADLLVAIKQFSPDQKPDPWFVYGYNQAKMVAAVLEIAVENGDLSRAGISAARDQLKDVDFGGLTGQHKFGPVAERELPRQSSVFEIDHAKAAGLGILEANFSSKAAEEYKF